MRTVLIITLILGFAAGAMAETVTADFEGGINLGDWTYLHYAEGINPSGGNPGGWYYYSFGFTFAPILQCAPETPYFTGNYAEAGVTRISGDFQTTYCENGGAHTFPFTVLLRNNMGTPGDIEDDVYVYPTPTEPIPWLGEGWKHFDFDIPSSFTGAPGELPAGWLGGSYWTGGDIFPSDVTFHDVISNVSQVEFWWMHPAWFAIIVAWDVGADNITIEYDTAPVADEASSWGDVKSMFR
ncbi:hypothetical protein H8E07_15565 [bacterium]|nr:hypothetical protein [bacterium]